MAEASWNAFFTEPPKETADSEMVKDKIATALIFARLCFRYGAVGIYQILDNSVVEWERIAAPVTKILAKDRNEVETLAKDAEIQAAVDYILGNGLFNACSDLEAVSKFELTSVQHLALTQVILRVKSPSNLQGVKTAAGKDEKALEHVVINSILRINKKQTSAMLKHGGDVSNGLMKLAEFQWPDESEKLPNTSTTLVSKKEVAGELKKSGDQKTDKDEAAGATGPV